VNEYAANVIAFTTGHGQLGPYFCDHYESRGWSINGNPIRDWRAQLRTWKVRNGGRFNPEKFPDGGTTGSASHSKRICEW